MANIAKKLQNDLQLMKNIVILWIIGKWATFDDSKWGRPHSLNQATVITFK